MAQPQPPRRTTPPTAGWQALHSYSHTVTGPAGAPPRAATAPAAGRPPRTGRSPVNNKPNRAAGRASGQSPASPAQITAAPPKRPAATGAKRPAASGAKRPTTGAKRPPAAKPPAAQRQTGRAPQSRQTARPGPATGKAAGQTAAAGPASRPAQGKAAGGTAAPKPQAAPARPTTGPAAAAAALTPPPKRRDGATPLLLAALGYLLATSVAWWCFNGMLNWSTDGRVTLRPAELGFTTAYLVIAMLPAVFRLYRLAACLVAGTGLWRLYEFTSVLRAKNYETILDLFSPLFYVIMALSIAAGILLQLRDRYKTNRDGV